MFVCEGELRISGDVYEMRVERSEPVVWWGSVNELCVLKKQENNISVPTTEAQRGGLGVVV